jgi:hypothetical protein
MSSASMPAAVLRADSWRPRGSGEAVRPDGSFSALSAPPWPLLTPPCASPRPQASLCRDAHQNRMGRQEPPLLPGPGGGVCGRPAGCVGHLVSAACCGPRSCLQQPSVSSLQTLKLCHRILLDVAREKMKAEKLSLEDGALMRSLVDFPGGLELHIGVSHGPMRACRQHVCQQLCPGCFLHC